MSSIEKAIDRLSKARAEADKQKRDQPLDSDAKPPESDHKETTQKISVQEGETSHHPVLDFSKLDNTRYLVAGCRNKTLYEEYRSIKRPVLMNALGKGAAPVENGNLIAVTSALTGEGKTFTVINLALSIASELNSTVLVIDGDVLRASLSKQLGVEDKRGLTDLLSDSNTGVSDVLLTTEIAKLKVIPAGTQIEYSTELLASDAMERLIRELGSRYSDRIILFDSPPLLATSEAQVLMHLMGQILIVVEAGKTPLEAVKESLTHISDKKVTGMVLNKTTTRFGKGGYGGYYSSYY